MRSQLHVGNGFEQQLKERKKGQEGIKRQVRGHSLQTLPDQTTRTGIQPETTPPGAPDQAYTDSSEKSECEIENDRGLLGLWVQEGENTNGFDCHGEVAIARSDNDVRQPIGSWLRGNLKVNGRTSAVDHPQSRRLR